MSTHVALRSRKQLLADLRQKKRPPQNANSRDPDAAVDTTCLACSTQMKTPVRRPWATSRQRLTVASHLLASRRWVSPILPRVGISGLEPLYTFPEPSGWSSFALCRRARSEQDIVDHHLYRTVFGRTRRFLTARREPCNASEASRGSNYTYDTIISNTKYVPVYHLSSLLLGTQSARQPDDRSCGRTHLLARSSAFLLSNSCSP